MHRLQAYITLSLIFIIIITIAYLPVMFILKKRGKSFIRQLSYIGLFCSVFLIVFATILYIPITFKPENYTLNIVPFSWIGSSDNVNQFIIEKIPNIILFIPLGFFIPIVFKGMRKGYKTWVVSFVTSFSIEFIQYFIGRSSDIDDIMTNLMGAIIGYIIFKAVNKMFRNTKGWRVLLNRSCK